MMNPVPSPQPIASTSHSLRLFRPTPDGPALVRWRINGHHAYLIFWTLDEWERLSDRPTDAQFVPNGFWCALRIE